ncbi:MAG: MMPL family transporter [Desulfobacteraceae bacterium]|nr:MMPL family transporter [Desulfobacteraceae bacterium]MBC2754639.1 MMPL family transporter [Desulfobacteraceae bacterium]
MINTYLNLILRRPLIPILGLIVITVYLALGILKIQFDSSIESFMPKNDEAYIEYEETKEKYGDNDRIVIMSVSHENLWSGEAFEIINKFIIDIEEYENYDIKKENRRVNKFYAAIRLDTVRFKNIIDRFEDDPAFVRFLKRNTPEKLQTKNHLSQKDITHLEKIVSKNIELKKTEIIDNIISPFTAKDISGENDTLEAYDLIETDTNSRRIIPQTPEAIQAFKQRLEKNPAFKKGIYAVAPKTGEITDFGVIIKFNGTLPRELIVCEIIDMINYYKELKITASGVPYVVKYFNDYIRKDITKNVPLVLLVVTLIFYLNFRSKRGVILPLATLGMAEIWTIGLMGHLGYKITSVGITLPPLLISVGSSYAIHILNQYYTDFNLISQKGKREGLKEAMSHISTTVFLAGLTTFAAFITLVTSQVSAMQEWAVFSATGILFAVFISVTLIPCALAILPHRFPKALIGKDKKQKITAVDRFLRLTATLAVNHHKKVYAIVGVILAVSIAGVFKLRVDTDIFHYFKKNDPIRQNVIISGEKFGGGWGFNIIIDSDETDGVKNPEFLKTIESLRKWLVAEQNADLHVGRTDAFSDFIKRMHMAMNNGDLDYFKIPENRMDILDYLEIYSGEDEDSDGRIDNFEPFVDVFFQKSNILVRLARKESQRIGTSEINHIVRKIKQHLANTLPADYSFIVTGYPVINTKLAHYVVTGQMQGLFLSLILVAVVIILLFKKFSAGPLALIDMGVTILINFGIMGWFGIDLDMVTSVIAAITIGIGVDDTIHFLNTYRVKKHRGVSASDAIQETMFVAGKAIVYTSLALTCGFLVLTTSNFTPIILFGFLLSLTMINTTIGSILLIPAAIRLTGIELDPKNS